MRYIIPWITLIRDLFDPYLSKWFIKRLIGSYDFAFIAHPLSFDDLTRQFPSINKNDIKTQKFISKNLWPIIGSQITGFRDSKGHEIRGYVNEKA